MLPKVYNILLTIPAPRIKSSESGIFQIYGRYSINKPLLIPRASCRFDGPSTTEPLRQPGRTGLADLTRRLRIDAKLVSRTAPDIGGVSTPGTPASRNRQLWQESCVSTKVDWYPGSCASPWPAIATTGLIRLKRERRDVSHNVQRKGLRVGERGIATLLTGEQLGIDPMGRRHYESVSRWTPSTGRASGTAEPDPGGERPRRDDRPTRGGHGTDHDG